MTLVTGIVGGVLIAYLMACLILRVYQNRLLFSTSDTYSATPATYQLPYEEVWFSAQSGLERLYGWWMPTSQAKWVLLYVRGPYQNMSLCFDDFNRSRIEAFRQAGYSILVFDYRGTGNSQGQFPTEHQLYADVEAAWNYLTQARAIQPGQIVIYGLSFGGAIALHLALRQPQARGLIMEGAFTSILDMLSYRQQFWMFPRPWLVTQKFDSLGKITRLSVPLLLIHGTADSVVPMVMSQQLLAAAPVPKKLLLVEGANHWNVGQVAGKKYMQVVQQFTTESIYT